MLQQSAAAIMARLDNERGTGLLQRLGWPYIRAEAPFLHDARPEVLHQNVRPVGEAPQDVAPLLPVQVQGDAAPVAALHAMQTC